MIKHAFAEQLPRRPISRRQALRTVAAGGLAVGLVPVTARLARAAVDLMIFEWAGYEIPELHPEFIEAHGASPSYSFFAEEDEAFQKLRAGFQPDLAHPCTLSVGRWRDAGLIRPIDSSRIERWSDISPALLNVPGIEQGGEIWLMPWDWGNTSVLYRTDQVEPEENSYSAFLDERYKGKVSLANNLDDTFLIAAALAGVEDHLNMSDEELEKATEILKKMHENVRFYWNDVTELEQAMASGEVVLSNAWNSSYVALANQDIPVEYMDPKEGKATWVCGFTLMNNAPGSEDQAYDYLNTVLDPEVGKYVIEEYGYGFSNKKAFEIADKEVLAAMGMSSDLDSFLKDTLFEGEIPPETRGKMIQIFENTKAGY